MWFWDGSGISWTICKQSASRSRQITSPAPHRSIFTGWMLFLMPSQQYQSTGIDMEQNYATVTLCICLLAEGTYLVA